MRSNTNHHWWWKGGKTHNHGYILLYRPENPRSNSRGYMFEHILVAEKALGHPLPIKAQVHHVDGVKSNNSGNNLVICPDRTYHALLHQRANIIRAGGNPVTQKVCSNCRQLKMRSEFYSNESSRGPGALHSWCKSCERERRNRSGVKEVCQAGAADVAPAPKEPLPI